MARVKFVEIQARFQRDEVIPWEQRPVSKFRLPEGSEKSQVIETARWIDAHMGYFIEARWNYVGSLQGHYISRIAAGLE